MWFPEKVIPLFVYELPSPNVITIDGDPEQFAGAELPVNETGVCVVAMDGIVIEHDREQTAGVKLTSFMQVVRPQLGR